MCNYKEQKHGYRKFYQFNTFHNKNNKNKKYI